MRIDRVHRLLDALPELPVRSTHVHALIVLAAHRAGLDPLAWLNTRIAALAEASLDDADDGKAVENLFFQLAGTRPFPDARQTLTRLAVRLPRERFDDVLSAAASAPTLPPPTPLRDVLGARRVLTLYDPRRVRAAPKEEDRKGWFERLAHSGHEREIPRVRSAQLKAVERLSEDAPNLREPADFVLGQLAAARRRGALALPPILLVGPPAAGKTWWAERLAAALCVPSTLIAMPGVTASWELSGGSASWNSSQPGRFVRTLLSTRSASVVFVLDEIEKSSPGNYNPAPVLLHLLERANAKAWRDEFFDTEFDLSRAIVIATANRPELMDSALRSRFREFHVEAPRRSERAPIIESVWRQFRRDAALRLPATLPEAVVAHLADTFTDARAVQRAFDAALGRASLRPGRLQLLPADFGAPAAQLVRDPQPQREATP